ncbi:hypothetical protein [Alkalihalobacillus trypoxylicola]|uniref:Uncharacterized protein n=1 Tax=Alkalihalobacillus trypoxylicola TaxID=519424 RepID=A0A161PGF1_9BACI|nr:hypothetical protein [Alkalihalobacillus trypoxylicola]KYG32287.1 hypothetical protein AZF04_05840 [Alkalihalobacillus trypoxylicola]
MELLDWLKDQYKWKEAKFIHQALIESDQGSKKIHFWLNKDLLDWHIEWRDKCSVTPCVIVDRMIRTKDQKAFIEWKDGWITVHDHVSEGYPEKGHEVEWGSLIGAMIKYGQETNSSLQPIQRTKNKYSQLEQLLPLISSEQRGLLKDYLQEKNFRMKKSEQLTELCDQSPPLIDCFYSVNQAKKIHGVLLWNGTVEPPEQSYHGIRHFLMYWLKEHGEDSFHRLLESISDMGGLNEEQMYLLLSECLKPYEMNLVVETIQRNEKSEQDIKNAIHYSLSEWKHSKILVNLLSKWFDSRKRGSKDEAKTG